MNYSFFSRTRDILLLCALLFLGKIAFDRTTSFIAVHKKSIVHELDRTFIDQLYTAQRQLHFLEEHPIHGSEFAVAITDIKSRLVTIEDKYKTNSPGIMLLGPIGSAAIVAKEEKLQKQLLEIANDINNILHTVNNPDHELKHLATISIALESNKKLLQAMTV